jgi:hypothetical protein
MAQEPATAKFSAQGFENSSVFFNRRDPRPLTPNPGSFTIEHAAHHQFVRGPCGILQKKSKGKKVAAYLQPGRLSLNAEGV